MSTDIAEVPTEQLQKALWVILKHQKMNDYSPESEMMEVKIGDLTLNSAQISEELDIRRERRNKQYRNFQWDVHHLAEDCIMTLGPEDEEAIGRLLEGITEFRAKFSIRSCPSCRQEVEVS